MKVAQVTGFFMPKKYGSNELFLCRELSKRGHDVTVFTSAKPRREYSMLNENYASKNIEHYEHFTIKRFPSRFTIRDIQIMPELLQSLLNEKFDIIHAHEFFSPSAFYSGLAKVLRQTPLIITQHNDQPPFPAISRYLYYADACTVGRFSLIQAKKIIALTKASRSHLLLFGAPSNKIEIIPTPIDTNKFVPNNQNMLKDRWKLEPPIILFVGRFTEIKGIKYLLKAFPTVLKAVPDAKLVLVGGGLLETEVRVYQKKFHNSIFWLPFVSNDIMPNIYAGCDVVVLPSFYEPFGNVVVEAMACGKPVVGSCIGGMLDTIVHEETGLHVQPGDSDQIANSLIKILMNDNLRETLGQNARKRALRDFSYSVVIKRVEKLYLNSLYSDIS
jgi:glycosyltransferase involved in cell wall biosynthesis